jgi:LmbE family N-acetylglucosaminyl deacetylase
MKSLVKENERVLIVAAHPDDETIGMGGSIRRFTDLGCSVRVVFLSDGVSSRDAQREPLVKRQNSSLAALSHLGVSDVNFSKNPDNMLDTLPLLEIAKQIEFHVLDFEPKTVFTHFPFDLNIDHKLVSEATQIACRPKVSSPVNGLLFFEVASSTNWHFGLNQFTPNYFIDITTTLSLKEKALQEYAAELDSFPNNRSLENLVNLSRTRGSFIGFEAAEAFQVAFIRE